MKRKPWPLIILTILHFLAPVGNILINSFILKVDISTYFRALYHSFGLMPILVFLIAPVLGGVLIYICKKWSYYLYLGLMVIPVLYSYFYWKQQPSIERGLFVIALFLINILVVSYFMLPQVRQVYFNSRLRWWETKPRFEVEFKAELNLSDHKAKCDIKNISQGGLFIETDMQLNSKDRIQINFIYKNQNYVFSGDIVYSKVLNGRNGYGVSLIAARDENRTLKKLIHSLNVQGLLINSRAPTEQDSFSYWVKQLFHHKKGLLPDSNLATKKLN